MQILLLGVYEEWKMLVRFSWIKTGLKTRRPYQFPWLQPANVELMQRNLKLQSVTQETQDISLNMYMHNNDKCREQFIYIDRMFSCKSYEPGNVIRKSYQGRVFRIKVNFSTQPYALSPGHQQGWEERRHQERVSLCATRNSLESINQPALSQQIYST